MSIIHFSTGYLLCNKSKESTMHGTTLQLGGRAIKEICCIHGKIAAMESDL